MKLCEYGCGQKAKFPPGKRRRKWCCSEFSTSCPVTKKKISKSNKNKIFSVKHRENLRKSRLNKKHCKETKKKIGMASKLSIKKINKRYPFFSKIEEMRYDPEKLVEKEIQVHCKNNNCKNSKEKSGWFTPSLIQIQERIRALEKPHGMIENNFYCSEECKSNCNIFMKRTDPFKNELSYTREEYKIFKQHILERDNYECQYCSEKAEHVHHERPQKLEPFFALDLDLAWSCCERCHYKYGHKTGSECSTGRLANKIC